MNILSFRSMNKSFEFHRVKFGDLDKDITTETTSRTYHVCSVHEVGAEVMEPRLL